VLIALALNINIWSFTATYTYAAFDVFGLPIWSSSVSETWCGNGAIITCYYDPPSIGDWGSVGWTHIDKAIGVQILSPDTGRAYYTVEWQEYLFGIQVSDIVVTINLEFYASGNSYGYCTSPAPSSGC
jgi:hypothetical protein